ncbi:hypothetical protein ACU4HD_35830 [Cupriavidus basilensis]
MEGMLICLAAAGLSPSEATSSRKAATPRLASWRDSVTKILPSPT